MVKAESFLLAISHWGGNVYLLLCVMSLLMSAIITYSIFGKGSLGQWKVAANKPHRHWNGYKETQSETKKQPRKVQLHRDKNRTGTTDTVVVLPSLHSYDLQRYWDDLVYAATSKIKTNFEWTTLEKYPHPRFTSLVLRESIWQRLLCEFQALEGRAAPLLSEAALTSVCHLTSGF